MNKHTSIKALLEIINQALDEQGISARQASILATGTPELIRNMRRGRVPSVESFGILCDVLNIEFYVGPMRSQSLISTTAENEEKAISSVLREILSRLPPRKVPRNVAESITSYQLSKSDDVYQIPIFEISANEAEAKTLINKNKQIPAYMLFQKSWLDEHGLNPEHCVMVQVCDNSMDPTITNHSIVLVDRSRCRRLVGHIYAIRIGNNLVIKRLTKSKDEWQLAGDYPKCKSYPFPDSAEIIGEVRWMARTFE